MKDLKAFEALIDRWVTTQNFIGKDALSLKIELLALTLDKLNIIAEAAGWKVGLLDARAIDMGRCDIAVTPA